MFKLDLSKTFLCAVVFTLLDEQGRQQKHEIKLRFKRISSEANRQLLADIQQLERDRKAASEEGLSDSPRQQLEIEADFLLKVVDGWEGVDIGGDTQFNRDNLIRLIDAVPNLIGEIWSAFFTASSGGQKRKN